jgi:hypothetical protein
MNVGVRKHQKEENVRATMARPMEMQPFYKPVLPRLNLLPHLAAVLCLLLLLSRPDATTEAFVLHLRQAKQWRIQGGATSTVDGDGPLSHFRSFFQGEFDNAAQVASERAQGIEAGLGGGHEQIHCVLEPLELAHGVYGNDSLFCVGATYYFDGRPDAVFRCRVYSFHPPPPSQGWEDEEDGSSFFLPPLPFAEMRLHRFTPAFETIMRKNNYDMRLLQEPCNQLAQVVEELTGCSILWSACAERIIIGHDIVGNGEGDRPEVVHGARFQGEMREGFCLVDSQREANVRLKIEDDLLLTADMLSVNDRGTDCRTGELVYGNHQGLPYRMQRRR